MSEFEVEVADALDIVGVQSDSHLGIANEQVRMVILVVGEVGVMGYTLVTLPLVNTLAHV